MITYKQLLILGLSNITKWKSEAEMIIPEEMRKDFGRVNTCELLGDGRYILRGYYKNGQTAWKIEYQNGLQHRFSLGWHENGHQKWRVEYQNGQPHGKSIGWREDGVKWREDEWQNGRFVRNIKLTTNNYLYSGSPI